MPALLGPRIILSFFGQRGAPTAGRLVPGFASSREDRRSARILRQIGAAPSPTPADQGSGMEAPRTEPAIPAAPRLRLLENKEAAPEASFASLRAWVVLFGALSFAGGHGVFLVTALTRLEKLPGQAELGTGLELAVIAWFFAAAPLAIVSAALRRRFLALSSAAGWSLASSALAATLFAFAYYLHAVALA
jgi:hypothetical protein